GADPVPVVIGRFPLRVDDGELTPADGRIILHQGCHDLAGRVSCGQQREPSGAEARVGAMLRQHCTHTCLCKGAAAPYADTRRGDCCTEHPRLTTHTNHREGHGDLSPTCSGILSVREMTV